MEEGLSHRYALWVVSTTKAGSQAAAQGRFQAPVGPLVPTSTAAPASPRPALQPGAVLTGWAARCVWPHAAHQPTVGTDQQTRPND